MRPDSNLRCSPLRVAALQAAAVAAEPHMHGGAQLSRTVIPRGSLRVQAGLPHRWRYAPTNKLPGGERVKRSSPLRERLASNEVGLSRAQAIHGGTHCNRNRISFEIASASDGAPAPARFTFQPYNWRRVRASIPRVLVRDDLRLASECNTRLCHLSWTLVREAGLEPPLFTTSGRSFTGCCRRR